MQSGSSTQDGTWKTDVQLGGSVCNVQVGDNKSKFREVKVKEGAEEQARKLIDGMGLGDLDQLSCSSCLTLVFDSLALTQKKMLT